MSGCEIITLEFGSGCMYGCAQLIWGSGDMI